MEVQMSKEEKKNRKKQQKISLEGVEVINEEADGRKLNEIVNVVKVKRLLKSKLFGFIMSCIQLVFTVILLAQLLYLNILPAKFFIPLTLLLLLFSGYTFLTIQSKKFRTFGKILAGIFTLIWSFGIYYIGSANGMFDDVSGANEKIDIINVYVMKDNAANSIADAKDYKFGILESLDRDNTDMAVKDIEDNVGGTIELSEYASWPDMLMALYDGTVDAIILNKAYVLAVTETDSFKNFEADTRVLHEKKIVTEINVDTDKDVTNNTFAVYISGIDVSGAISTTSRSDVNILAVVNPDTRQILLINTPRDYYVPLAIKNTPMDKLTHAGIYGVDTSMGTLGNLYGINIDYYFRINFTGFKNVIDALGGVTVHSDYAFTTTHGGYNIKKGDNNLNGEQALGFVRERYAFGDGDNQRGKNQMALISAIIDEMTSASILNDFSGLMDSLSGSFQTSMSSSQISSIVRMQLNEGGSWNVVNYAVKGLNGNNTQYCYSLGSSNWVMWPDTTTVEEAKTLIKQVYDGKIVNLKAIE